MSGDVAVNMDRRRSSIGVDERALTTLEKFVELCESELNEEDEDNEDDTSSANPSTSEGLPTSDASSAGDRGTVKKCPSTGDATKEREKSRKEKIYSRLNSLSWNYKPRKSEAHKVKLSELFIDPSLVAMKTKSETSSQNNGTNSTGAVGGDAGGATKSGTKKSEEIWVKRVNDPGRRSFRITNLRGQELPTILTEDVDEESGDGSYPTHYHTVTGATPGIQQMLKPILLSKGERERHRSGDDINLAGKKKTSLMDVFRPRSKSDASKLKKPNFMSKMQNSILGGPESQASSSSGHRPRSGSESTKSPVSKVMDIFRTRSHSVTTSDDKRKKHGSSNSWIQQGRRGSFHSHRPADALIDPAHAAILFRDSRGLPVTDPFLERILTLSEEDQTEILVKFFKFHKCYDLIPTSAKLVVFDTQLLVKKAFFALVYNGVRAAPLWDSSVRQFVGMLTITDFIRVLHAMYHDSAGRMSELEEHRIETWRRRFLQDKQPLIFIDPDASLFDAICSLVNSRIHRLPIIDQQTGNVLHILTHKRILKFLFLYIHEIPRPAFLNLKLGDVLIGTYDNVETAREDTSIIQALQKFLDRRVSALPIVDDDNKLLDIYARFDVINLAAEKTYNNLDITLKQANEHRNEWFEGVHKCTLEETLYVIMERIVKAEVHRLVVVDELHRVVGVLSLSDILQYLVMRPEVKDIEVPDMKELILREDSPRLSATGSTTPIPSPPPTDARAESPSLPSGVEDASSLQEEIHEANNNSLPLTDLNDPSDDNATIAEENEKNLNGHAVGSSI